MRRAAFILAIVAISQLTGCVVHRGYTRDAYVRGPPQLIKRLSAQYPDQYQSNCKAISNQPTLRYSEYDRSGLTIIPTVSLK